MLNIPFKQRFAAHLVDPPFEFGENLLKCRGHIVFDCVKQANPKGMIEVEIDRIIKNMEALHGEQAMFLSQEDQLRMCLEIAVSATAIVSTSNLKGTLLNTIDKLIAAKNHDYGFAFAKWGSWGVIIRMWDKILRAINLLDMTTEQPWVAESLSDTFNDLAGYAVLLYTLLRDESHKFETGRA